MRKGSRRGAMAQWAADLSAYLPDPLFQPVWPHKGRLKAMRLIAPLYQGEHVGLSGLYALVNAFRLALAAQRPLGHEEARRLLVAGIRFLETHGALRHAMTGGIRLGLWRRLGDALREHVAIHFGANIQIERPFWHGPILDTHQLLAVFETLVQRQRPVIVLRRGAHYTIIAGYTPSSLILFDSAGHCWVRRDACGAGSDAANVRHRLYPASLTTVAAFV